MVDYETRYHAALRDLIKLMAYTIAPELIRNID